MRCGKEAEGRGAGALDLVNATRLAIVSCWLLASVRAPAEDWPQILGPRRDGTYRGGDLAEGWAAEGPPVVWKKSVGHGFSGPAVTRGRLILFHRLGDKETVDCLDASTGEKRWTFDYPTSYHDSFGFDDGPRATPTIADGRIYTHGAEGKIHCLDLEKGTSLWEFDARAQLGAAEGYFGLACSPLVEGNRVLLNIGGKDGAGVIGLEKSSGKLSWKATSDEASYSSPVAATIGGKRLALFFTRAGLVGIDPVAGPIQFEFPWKTRIRASANSVTPLIQGDLVFVSACYGAGAALVRIKGRQTETVWSGDESLSNHYATSVLHGGFLYGFHGRQEEGPSLRCVELETGKVKWSKDRFGAGSLLEADGKLLILTEEGKLVIAPARPEGFEPTASAQILPEGVARALPGLADGRLYARNESLLVCIDLRRKK